MNLAIIETGGKQYLVSANSKIQVEKLSGDEGSTIKLDKVLMLSTDKGVELGKPHISGAIIEAKVLRQARGKKILVFKYKSKSRYRRKQGHRQEFTELEILKV